jgi:2,3-dihydroxyphenylpropionate 1,2-dioxygenase
MAKIVAGLMTSHAPFMHTSFEAAKKAQAENVANGFARLKKILREAQPDVMFVIADDHFRHCFLDNMPMFCVGIGECEAWGDWQLPKYKIPIAQGFARAFLRKAIEAGFDLAFSVDLRLDHGHVLPLHYIVPEMNIPIIPIIVNCFAAPIPTPRRCYQLGQYIRSFIEQRPQSERVAILSSGGLSHWVPFPKIDRIETEEDQRWFEIMVHGKSNVMADSASRQAAVETVAASGLGRINEEFDHHILDLIARGEGAKLGDYTNDQIEAGGFNGGNELLNWIVLIGALPGRKAMFSLYEAVPEWITGIGMVALDVTS